MIRMLIFIFIFIVIIIACLKWESTYMNPKWPLFNFLLFESHSTKRPSQLELHPIWVSFQQNTGRNIFIFIIHFFDVLTQKLLTFNSIFRWIVIDEDYLLWRFPRWGV